MLKWLKVHKPNFTKLIVAWLVLNGTAWIWCSYYLAYKGMPEIAETLSKAVVVEILGVVLFYALKATAENFSKHNQWPDNPKNNDTTNRDM